MELMTTYLTRSLTSYSYMIGAIFQKVFSKTHISYTNPCDPYSDNSYGGNCGAGSYESPRTNPCGQPIGGGYRGNC